jgi:hypothetical protein
MSFLIFVSDTTAPAPGILHLLFPLVRDDFLSGNYAAYSSSAGFYFNITFSLRAFPSTL